MSTAELALRRSMTQLVPAPLACGEHVEVPGAGQLIAQAAGDEHALQQRVLHGGHLGTQAAYNRPHIPCDKMRIITEPAEQVAETEPGPDKTLLAARLALDGELHCAPQEHRNWRQVKPAGGHPRRPARLVFPADGIVVPPARLAAEGLLEDAPCNPIAAAKAPQVAGSAGIRWH